MLRHGTLGLSFPDDRFFLQSAAISGKLSLSQLMKYCILCFVVYEHRGHTRCFFIPLVT